MMKLRQRRCGHHPVPRIPKQNARWPASLARHGLL